MQSRPSAVLFLGLAGFLAGTGWLAPSLYARAFHADDSGLLPGYVVWVALAGTQAALWAVLAPALWLTVYRLRHHFRRDGVEIVLATVLLVVLFYLPSAVVFPPSTYRFLSAGADGPDPQLRMQVFGAVGALGVGLPGVVGMWLVRAAVRRKVRGVRRGPPGDADLVAFIALRSELQRLLTIVGALVGAATLAAGALRGVALSASFAPAGTLPVGLIWLYGLYLTALLALAYLSAYGTVVADGYRLVDALFPIRAPAASASQTASAGSASDPAPAATGALAAPTAADAAAWSAGLARRKDLEDLLQLRLSPLQSLQTSVAVLAPFTGSVVGALVGAVAS